MKLRIAESLVLPIETVTEKLAFLGRTGSGKTYAAMKLAELMLEAGAQIVSLDPVGAWHGLRIGGSWNVYIFGGMRGDFPLEPTGGKLMADVVADRGISAVLDVSQFIRAEQVRFASDFIERFFQRKKAAPSAVHLFLEECQEFVPQNPGDREAHMLHHFERAWKLGRNFGIGGSLISQRPQEINKKALNQAGTLFVFNMTGPQERRAIADWTRQAGIDEDIESVLPTLTIGEPHVWSPTFLSVSKTVRILPKVTADVSMTPKVGARTKEQPLTPIDVQKLTAEMAATIEKSKAEDPKELRKEILALKQQIASLQKAKPEVAKVERVEVPILTEDDRRKFEGLADVVVLFMTDLDGMKGICAEILELCEKVAKARTLDLPIVKKPLPIVKMPKPQRPLATDGPIADGTQQRIVDAIAMLNVRGIGVTREAVARWMGIHPNGGRYLSGLAALRAFGYLDGWSLTSKGQAAARDVPTGIDATLAALIDGTCRRSLEVLVEAHPQALSRDELATRMGIHPNGGRYLSGLAWLRQMGVITERSPIQVTDGAFR